MKRTASFALVLLVAFSLATFLPSSKAASEAPQVRLEKTYGPIEGRSIMHTADGGYDFTGYTASGSNLDITHMVC